MTVPLPFPLSAPARTRTSERLPELKLRDLRIQMSEAAPIFPFRRGGWVVPRRLSPGWAAPALPTDGKTSWLFRLDTFQIRQACHVPGSMLQYLTMQLFNVWSEACKLAVGTVFAPAYCQVRVHHGRPTDELLIQVATHLFRYRILQAHSRITPKLLQEEGSGNVPELTSDLDSMQAQQWAMRSHPERSHWPELRASGRPAGACERKWWAVTSQVDAWMYDHLPDRATDNSKATRSA
jgi:hypothetical protein